MSNKINTNLSKIISENNQIDPKLDIDYTIKIISNEYIWPIDQYIKNSLFKVQKNVLISIEQIDEIPRQKKESKKADFIYVIYNPFKNLNTIDKLLNKVEHNLNETKLLIDLEIDKILTCYGNQKLIFIGFNLDNELNVVIKNLHEISSYYINKLYQSQNNVILKSPISLKLFSDFNCLSSNILRKFSNYALSEFSRIIFQNILLRPNVIKKVIFFDCDNTLWSGILGDIGIENVTTYNEIQRLIKWLISQGVLIGLITKNNQENVQKYFLKNNELKIEDFIVVKSNWLPKSINIENSLVELNLDCNSAIFIDDSEAEIFEVQRIFPDLISFKVPENYLDYVNLLIGVSELFFVGSKSREDDLRALTYKTNADRNLLAQSLNNYTEYLYALNLSYSIKWNTEIDSTRASQLSLRTNQFNLTQRRYSEEQIQLLLAQSNFKCFTVSIKDRFSDLGVIAFCVMKLNQNNFVIEELVLSCRAFGRDIEKLIMKIIKETANSFEVDEIFGKIDRNVKNQNYWEYFSNFGFRFDNENENSFTYTCKTTDVHLNMLDENIFSRE